MLPNVKLGTFKGDTCLETFLAKFENISSYLNWGPPDRLFHLRASLEGAAGQILWDTGTQTSAEVIMRMLRARFGNENQAERFRAELRARRRKKGESLQSLYNDICRLLVLAYPGPSNGTTAIVGRDAFLDALENQNLHVRILEREPKTLEEALSIASKLEAYERTATPKDSTEYFDETSKGRHRHAREIRAGGPDPSLEATIKDLSRQLAELRREVELQRQNASAHRSNASARQEDGPKPCWPNASEQCQTASAQWVSTPYQYQEQPTQWTHVSAQWVKPSAQLPSFPAQQQTTAVDKQNQSVQNNRSLSNRNRNKGGPKDSACYGCGSLGHYRRDCPKENVNQPPQQDPGSQLGVISAKVRAPEIYVNAQLGNRQILCILDTGCERSIIGRKLIPDVELTDTNMEVFAANGASIPLIGATTLRFSIDGHSVKAHVVVTDVIEELILGIDWLATNGCRWDFSLAKVWIGDQEIQTHNRPTRLSLRKIYASQAHEIPPGYQHDIPVKITYSSLANVPSDWVFEPKTLRPGVVAARTLLDGRSLQGAVRVVNYSNSVHRLRSDQYLGAAELTEDTVNIQVTAQTRQLEANGLDHVQSLIDNLPKDLSSNEYRQAADLIRSHESLFSKSEFDLGRTHLAQHRIDTGNHRPFRQSLRHHPIAHLPLIDEHVNEMLQHDVIEPAASPWASNIVLIRKKDGSLRFCVDYRQLNALTYKDSYPLPRIDSCLQSLGGAKFFSTLDLRAGYWQT